MQVVGLLIQIEGIQSAIIAVCRSPHFEERWKNITEHIEIVPEDLV